MGVAVLSPGILAFQRMFVFSSQLVGGLPVGATPLASGPRHCAQFCDWGADTLASTPKAMLVTRHILDITAISRMNDCPSRFKGDSLAARSKPFDKIRIGTASQT